MNQYLKTIDSPARVKKLTAAQLEILAEEIRQELIEVISKNGGHLGPNLGVVELTLALHKVFDTPKDKFVWDVSHQAYVHKLLTGRRARFNSIRSTGGLNGFALRTESEHDAYGAGHAGTALSAALGMCAARDQNHGKEHVVAIFGDAALTNGITFEALNNIHHTTKQFIGILNDNEWSIAKNVGAIAKYLNKLSTNPRYNSLKKDVKRFMSHLPKGASAIKFAQKTEEGLKGVITGASLQPGMDTGGVKARGGQGNSLMFEELGLRYIGPIDGHNLEELIYALEFAKQFSEPVLLHVITQKGKGYELATRHPEKFHGVGPYDIATGQVKSSKPGTPPAWQDVFGETMVRLCRVDPRVVGITAAMPSGTGLKLLAETLPGRYYDVGIAEEHAVIFASGMAAQGMRPFCAIYSTFLQRAYDCIIHDVALQDLPVTFCMDRAGLSPQDGPTHHGLFDIAYLRPVPNIIAMAPKDEDELADMMYTATQHNHPVFIRYPRGPAEGVRVKSKPEAIEVGKAEIVQPFVKAGTSPKVAIFGLGNMGSLARQVAEKLMVEGYNVAIINPRFIKPLDAAAHERFGKTADVLVTLEDHVLSGGYGSAVLEVLSGVKLATPVVRVGWPDQFIEHASSQAELRAKYGFTAEKIIERIKKNL